MRFPAGSGRSQDGLTLLSPGTIYMDGTSAPDRARPEIWRQGLRKGARGRQLRHAVACRGPFSSLALTSARYEQVPIFRDVAHHFLRRFDRAFCRLWKQSIVDGRHLCADRHPRTSAAPLCCWGVGQGTFD